MVGKHKYIDVYFLSRNLVARNTLSKNNFKKKFSLQMIRVPVLKVIIVAKVSVCSSICLSVSKEFFF